MSGRKKRRKNDQDWKHKKHKKRRKQKMLHLGEGAVKEIKVHEPYTYRYLNPEKLMERCFAEISDFSNIGETVQTPSGVYYYQNNGKKILAVAHLDTVQHTKKFIPVEGGRKIYNPQVDDRLGAYAILDLLPSLGLEYDILLTEGEETGNSTAKHFVAPEGKEYLWMMEIDRMGTDTVCYQYENDKLVERLQSVGCRVGIGSFTDISVLGHLKVQGMNFGCGYYNNHSTEAYFMVNEFEDAIDRIIKFYDKFKNTKLVYDPATCKRRSYSYVTYSSSATDTHYSRYTKDYAFICDECETYPCICRTGTVITRTNQYCKHCGSLKIGNYCDDYCELMDSQCSVCDEPSCLGVGPCDICSYLFHNDKYVRKFSMCKDCIVYFMQINGQAIEDFEKLGDQESVDTIKELLYQ